jgi:hypothetical protein
MRALVFTAVLLAAPFSTLPAAAQPAAPPAATATGSFRSQGTTLDVQGGVAFRGKSFFDQSDALIVAVANSRIKADALAAYYDRRRAIEKHVRDEDTGVVYFEFRPDGRYRGLSYYFRSGNGCGYCAGETTSTVRLAAGRLTGKLKEDGRERAFDVALDVPVMGDEHGPALPADGGAPGSAYLAYHAALVKRDRAALRPLLSASQDEVWVRAEKANDVARFLDFLADEHPDQTVRIVRGFATDKEAVLLIAGQSRAGKVAGEVALVREKGSWRVDDEMIDLVAE